MDEEEQASSLASYIIVQKENKKREDRLIQDSSSNNNLPVVTSFILSSLQLLLTLLPHYFTLLLTLNTLQFNTKFHHPQKTNNNTKLTFSFSCSTTKLIDMRYCYVLLMVALLWSSAYGGNFYQDFAPTFGDHRVNRYGGGQLLSLTLDKASGAGFKSNKEYLFGRIDMQIKLVAGNSAGTVTAYYLTSQGANWDEIDFEFLGNVTGQPYTVHTNVFTQGKGNREQQFHLWFDPTKNFHTYSVVWHPQMIIFMVDNTPIRVFNNHESIGVPFPKSQPMKIYSSLWNADDWATQGGRVKTDWSKAPFTAYYRNFKAETSTTAFSQGTWQTRKSTIELDASSRRRLRWVQRYYMIYNYCNDYQRFPQGVPAECKRP